MRRTLILVVLLAILLCLSAQAQFIGYNATQTSMSTVLWGSTAPYSPIVYAPALSQPLANIGQGSHWMTVCVTGTLTAVQVKLLGIWGIGESIPIATNTSTAAGCTMVSGDGVYPLIQVEVDTVTGGSPSNYLTVFYSSMATTSSQNTFTGAITIPGTITVTNSTFGITPLTHVINGQQAVTASAAALPAQALNSFCVKALSTNSISVWVGGSTVTTATGLELTPGDSMCFSLVNTNLISLVASTTGASVSYIGSY